LEGVRFERFRLDLEGSGFFPGNRRPSVFWVGARDRDGALLALKSAVDSALSPAVPPDGRDFVPHITLARFKPRAPRRAVEAVAAAYDPPPPVSFDVGRFVLYSSELRPEGAVHRPMLEVPSS
jgi:2'-5' RNA ligase